MLSNLYKDKLQTIDNLLIEAIRAVFDERIEAMLPDDEVPNVELGDRYRAYLVGKKMIEQGFIDLLSYKIPPKTIKSFNKEK
jgi:hypothetical protein